jgi:tetraacyldisaccharide 4'-kinase
VRLAVEECGAEAVILDDGFQHLAVARDLDIVLLDARHPLGNGRVLPAGLLREFPAALRRADLLVLTRVRNGEQVALPVRKPLIRCRHLLAEAAVDLAGQEALLSELRGRRGVAFAGIADPEAFFTALEENGLQLVGKIALPDHIGYEAGALERVRTAAAGADFLVTTEKDGVKLRSDDFGIPCYQVPLTLQFADPGALLSAVDGVVGGGEGTT